MKELMKKAAGSAILNKKSAAEYLGVSTRWLENAAASGKIKVYKLSRQLWRIRMSELDRFLESVASIH